MILIVDNFYLYCLRWVPQKTSDLQCPFLSSSLEYHVLYFKLLLLMQMSSDTFEVKPSNDWEYSFAQLYVIEREMAPN